MTGVGLPTRPAVKSFAACGYVNQMREIRLVTADNEALFSTTVEKYLFAVSADVRRSLVVPA
jgi:hypothetical protein